MVINQVSPQDFIQYTFQPMIAVLCSDAVERTCKKNNLNFVDMIKPFTKIAVDGQLKDPSGAMVPIKNLRVSFTDVKTKPPPLPVARSYFNQVINCFIHDRTSTVNVGGYELDIPICAPWYDAWRDTFLQVQYPADHEFTKHYIGALLVASSEEENPCDRLQQMYLAIQDMIQYGPTKIPKWFTPPSFILIATLLINDNHAVDSSNCSRIMEEIKSKFGASRSFYIDINSQDKIDSGAQAADPWAHFVATSLSYKEGESKESDTISTGIETSDEPEETSVTSTSPSSSFIVHPLSPVTEEAAHPTCQDQPNPSEKHTTAQHGQLLSAEDINKIKMFIHDFCIKALIPHFENCILNLSEQVTNKKGVSRSLFSATKRWFGSNRTPGSPGNNLSPTAIAYSNDAHELQLRRLGDLCFMIGHYMLAYNAYHGAKREFSADGAWLHYAGALEMAALSAFMSGNEALYRKVLDYSEESIITYQNACRLNQFATRSTLLSVECLRGRGLYGEAAKRLIRMCGEDSDLRSAVLLEQAAYCFLSSRKPLMFRKYAFHMVLAGHRFNKAGHKNHSMRCYYQAYQIYAGKQWSIAEDHILYTISKTAAQMKLAVNALQAVSRLIQRPSRQFAPQQGIFLQEYINIIKNLLHDEVEAELTIPVIDHKSIVVILNLYETNAQLPPKVVSAYGGGYSEEHGRFYEDPKWWRLEEKLLGSIDGTTAPMIFRPSFEILSRKVCYKQPSVVIAGEPIGVHMTLCNPLHIPLKITGLCLVWRYKSNNSDKSKKKRHSRSKTAVYPDFILSPDSNKDVLLTVIPEIVGEFHITKIRYTLSDGDSTNCVSGIQPLLIDLEDKRLHFIVKSNAPKLEVNFAGLRHHIFSSETVPMEIHFTNSGEVDISRICIMSAPSFAVWIEGTPHVNRSGLIRVPLNNNFLYPGRRIIIPLVIHPNFSDMRKTLDLLFFYEAADKQCSPRYRFVRHSWSATSSNLFSISTIVKRSHSLAFKDEEAMNINISMGLNKAELRPSSGFKLSITCISIYSYNWKLTSNYFAPKDFTWDKDESVNFLIQAVKKKSHYNPVSSIYFVSKTKRIPYKFCIPFIDPNSVEDVYCLINWKTNTNEEYVLHSVQGQECIKLVPVQDTHFTLPSFIPSTLTLFGHPRNKNDSHLQRLIYYQLQHAPSMKHDFNKSRLCVLPVTLWLQNISDEALSIKIDLVTLPKDIADIEKILDCFAWVGKTEFTDEVDTFEKKCISLQAAFAAPGCYDFTSRVAVFVKVKDDMILQSCQIESSVIIF
ncbi:hypothetical protein O3M35_003881 [Rhynocoris fuscipes]|uniref:Trafficking protein particle complex subunit 8 n=1 Tax=Rhynocoris fuscipes TaxID=488301 RepID=A0AAW1CIU4_9HEMI